MDDAALKSLLEAQTRERAAVEQQLEESRQARAKARAEAELAAPGLRPPGMLKPMLTPAMVDRHVHNLRLEDQQRVVNLDQSHLQVLARERVTAPGKQFNGQAKDAARAPAPPDDPGELARREENQRFRDESLRRFGFMQGRERGLGRGLRRDGAAGTDE